MPAPGGAQEPEIVTLVPSAVKLTAGKPTPVRLTLSIAKEFHIQSNTPKEGYIPTTVEIKAPKGYKIGKPLFPKASVVDLAGDKLPAFEGSLPVTISVTPPSGATGKVTLTVKVGYQACNATACYPPKSFNASVAAEVVGGKPAVKKAGVR